MDNFEIVAKIGEGSYSVVYTVRRKKDNKLYALKKVKMKSLNPKEKKNALNEVRILASVNSPYVISYKEAFIDEIDSTLCIVMEYADEGDLYQKITLYKKRNIHFELIDIWRIFIQITKGLHDLHEYNILHRDLKSANVFLFRDGTAKLGDLNVSKVAHRGLGCTQTGTPYYASPEIWKDNPYDFKSDIWSLGCVVYEMVMLRTPFRAETMAELYKKIMKGEYQKLSKNYCNDLDYVISLMLQVNAKARPTTEMILNLNEVKLRIEEYDVFRKGYNVVECGCGNNSDSGNGMLSENDILNKDNKVVLETIRMPKELVNLNCRLPTANYDNEKKEKKKEVNVQCIKNKSFPNVMLPNINNRYNFNKCSKYVIDNKKSSIQFKVNNKYNINEIDKENEGMIMKRNMSVSVNKYKDLKYIYRPYIPQILKNNNNNNNNNSNNNTSKTLKQNKSDISIFGNLNYSYNFRLMNYSYEHKNADTKQTMHKQRKKLIPILRIKLSSHIN